MTENDGLKIAYESLHAERDQLQSKIGELELQKDSLEDMEKQSEVQAAEFKEQIASLAASLEEAREQQTNIQPFKEHVLIQRRKMHRLQVSIEEERCKVLQVDNRLEEILETSSYFVDRSQDILEVLMGRIVRLEANEEIPADLLAKDQQGLKKDYDLLEFVINTDEEFKKVVKKTKGACIEFCRRLLITYHRCQVAAKQRMDTFLDQNLFLKMF